MAELGETTDPKALIPGEPGEIRTSTVHLTTYGDTMLEIGNGLNRLDTGGWTGKAADAFHTRFHDEPQRWLDAGDAFHSAATAINSYADTLEWAQGQASEAIRVWQQGEQTTAHAKAQHEQALAAAAQQAAAHAQPTPAEQPFQDPGEAIRDQARQTLNRAREQLDSAGWQAVGAVDRAQEHAPQEPTFLDEIGGAFTTAADWAGDQIGDRLHDLGADIEKGIENLGGLPEQIVDGVTNIAGDVVDDVGQTAGNFLRDLGDATGIEELHQAGDTVTSSLHEADDAIVHAGDVAEDAIRAGFHDAGTTVSGWIDDLADDISGDQPIQRAPRARSTRMSPSPRLAPPSVCPAGRQRCGPRRATPLRSRTSRRPSTARVTSRTRSWRKTAPGAAGVGRGTERPEQPMARTPHLGRDHTERGRGRGQGQRREQPENPGVPRGHHARRCPPADPHRLDPLALK